MSTPRRNKLDHYAKVILTTESAIKKIDDNTHCVHYAGQGQQAPDQTGCEEALWRWCSEGQHSHQDWWRRRHIFHWLLTTGPWMLPTKLGSSKLGPAGTLQDACWLTDCCSPGDQEIVFIFPWAFWNILYYYSFLKKNLFSPSFREVSCTSPSNCLIASLLNVFMYL